MVSLRGLVAAVRQGIAPKRTAPQKAAERFVTPLAIGPPLNHLPPALLKHRPPKLGGPARRRLRRAVCRPEYNSA